MLYKEIGKYITRLRKKQKMSQQELGDKIHKSKACISKYERGLSSIDLETFIDICESLEISPALALDTIISYKEEKRPPVAEAFQQKKLYICCYDTSVNRFVRSVIAHSEESGYAKLYSDVQDYTDLESAGNLYQGELAVNGNILSFNFKNYYHATEFGLILAMSPISKSKSYMGIMLGLSSLPIMPRADKIYLSETIPVEDEAMIQKLTFSKDQVKTIQKSNRIIPW